MCFLIKILDWLMVPFDWVFLPRETKELQRLNTRMKQFNREEKTFENLMDTKFWLEEQKVKYCVEEYQWAKDLVRYYLQASFPLK